MAQTVCLISDGKDLLESIGMASSKRHCNVRRELLMSNKVDLINDKICRLLSNSDMSDADYEFYAPKIRKLVSELRIASQITDVLLSSMLHVECRTTKAETKLNTLITKLRKEQT